jgi:hypothetical protein
MFDRKYEYCFNLYKLVAEEDFDFNLQIKILGNQ